MKTTASFPARCPITVSNSQCPISVLEAAICTFIDIAAFQAFVSANPFPTMLTFQYTGDVKQGQGKLPFMEHIVKCFGAGNLFFHEQMSFSCIADTNVNGPFLPSNLPAHTLDKRFADRIVKLAWTTGTTTMFPVNGLPVLCRVFQR